MQPDSVAAEQAAWDHFVQQLGAHLAAQWPAMPERLGERYAAFVEHAVQQADKRGITRAAAVARYVNLWFVWGPAFHDKPGFEWALGLLAAPREREWATVHQLVQRSLAELQRLPDARIAPDMLTAADARLTERFGALGRRGDLHPYEAAPLPLRACDLEAAELRLLEPAVAEHYVLLPTAQGQAPGQAPGWQRAPLPAPAPLRISAADPVPRLIGVLSNPPGARAQTRLQLRTRMHVQCDADVHPALHYSGSHGRWRWQGHEARALSWPVSTLDQPAPPLGPAAAIAEETSPEIVRLELQTCGLRDEGDAIGPATTQLWVWPATQYWLELQREAAAAQPVVAGQAPVTRGITRLRLEADGEVADSSALRQAFEQGLDRSTADALQGLLGLWSRVPGVTTARLEGALALLSGRAACSWGWRLGAQGMDGRALMRVLAEFQLQVCQAELQLEAELTLGDARARCVLRCAGRAPLSLSLRREQAEPPLLALMQGAQARFTLPFTAEITPLASDTGALLLAAGPCKAALAGEAGLRPRTTGGSGWEWFAALRVEAASLPVLVCDPVLGSHQQTLQLWPEQTLLEWKAG